MLKRLLIIIITTFFIFSVINNTNSEPFEGQQLTDQAIINTIKKLKAKFAINIPKTIDVSWAMVNDPDYETNKQWCIRHTAQQS